MEELHITNYKKEIYYLIISLFVIIMLAISFKIYAVYKFQALNEITTKIYKHPLKITNAVLHTQVMVGKLINSIEDISQSIKNANTQKTFESSIKEIEQNEIDISKNLNLIKKNLLRERGKKQYKVIVSNYEKIKSLKTDVIGLIKNDELQRQ